MKSRTQSLTAIGLVLAFCGAGSARAAESGEPTEANITRATAGLLEHLQFSWRPPDERLSSEFLHRYLEALDRARVLFLQSDLDDFSSFHPMTKGRFQRSIESQLGHLPSLDVGAFLVARGLICRIRGPFPIIHSRVTPHSARIVARIIFARQTFASVNAAGYCPIRRGWLS